MCLIFLADEQTLKDLKREFFTFGIEVMRLKKLKLELEIIRLNKDLGIAATPSQLLSSRGPAHSQMKAKTSTGSETSSEVVCGML